MRLAIIMSGMLRNFDHTYFATKKFLLKDEFFNQKDIFFCGYADTFDLYISQKNFKLKNGMKKSKNLLNQNLRVINGQGTIQQVQ